MRRWGLLAVVALCACDSADAAQPSSIAARTTTSSINTSVVTTMPVVPTTVPQQSMTSTLSAVDDHTDGITVRTVTAVPIVIEGDAAAVCDAAVSAADPNHDEWDGTVLVDETIDEPPVRWLVCIGDPASGQGPVALRTTDSHEWLLAALDLGPIIHAGDVATADALDGGRAFVTYESLVGEDHSHAFTRDGGQTWTITEIAT